MREVVADIDFDQSGVISLGNIGQAERALESQTVRTANVFTNRMFNMRTAAMAFLGGFTVAGAIVAFKNFMESAARGDPAFKSMATSATVMRNAWLEAVRATPGFHAAIQGIDTAFLHLAAGAKMFKALMTKDKGDFVEEYLNGLKEVQREHDRLMKQHDEFATMYRVNWADINQAGKDAWQTWTNFRDIVNEASTIIVEDLEPMKTQVQILTEAYEKFGLVSSAAFEAMDAAVAAGVVSTSAAARIRLAILAVESILKGKIEVAEAVAAAARYDFGSAALHGTAAGLYFAAAAFYGKGAVLGQGGGGGSAGAHAGAAAGFQPREESQPQRVINVYFPNATVLGGNRSQVGRDLADYLRAAERGGG